MSPAGYRYLRRQLDDLLWTVWDPIGVNDIAPNDEYLAYSTVVSDMLMNGNGTGVFDYLRDIETHHMGLSQTDEAKTRAVSAFACSLHDIAKRVR